MCWSHLFQQVDELISGQPLEQREVRELRAISPGTVSHPGQQSLIHCAQKNKIIKPNYS